jgi:hypothetical protein
MTWEPELEELRRREALAAAMGGEESVARQRSRGKLTVRDRIALLVDEGSWRETGQIAGRGVYGDDGALTDFSPTNFVVGQARVDGRPVVVQGDDFTVRGGAADASIWEKFVWPERAANELRLPLVRLVDGTGGGGSVKSLEEMGFSYVPPLPGGDLWVDNLAKVPVVAAALGPDELLPDGGVSRPAADREVVALDNDATALDACLADDEVRGGKVGERAVLAIDAPAGDLARFAPGALVDEQRDAVAHGELAARTLAGDRFVAAHGGGQGLAPAQLLELGFPGHARWEDTVAVIPGPREPVDET